MAGPLINTLRITDKADRELVLILKRAMADIDRQILRPLVAQGPGQIVRQAQLRTTRDALAAQIRDIYTQAGRVVQAGRASAQISAVDTLFEYDQVLKRAGLSVAEREIMRASAQQTAKNGIDAVRARQTSARVLARQVYRTQAFTVGVLDSRINSALARGLSAREFAGEVRDLVNPSTPGGVRYAAQRLARTEINNAFHEQTIRTAKGQDWITGFVWRLSGSHPKPDACNDYADVGFYTKDKVPNKPHPHCFCALIPQVIDQNDDAAFMKKLLGSTAD